MLVRLDGSRRLTPRNRRFVKRILSPPDLQDSDKPLISVQRRHPSPVVGGVEDEVPAARMGTDTPDTASTQNDMQQSMGQDHVKTGGEMVSDDVWYDEMEPVVLPLSPGQSESNEALAVGRPRRARRPNVKYSTDECDLSAVSATHQKKRVLSGMMVSRRKKKQKNI